MASESAASEGGAIDAEAAVEQEPELASPPYEAVSFKVISFAGAAKSCYLEAIELAKQGGDPAELIAQGDEAFRAASEAHHEALQMEAMGTLGCGLLLIHAETTLASAETIKGLLPTIVELAQR